MPVLTPQLVIVGSLPGFTAVDWLIKLDVLTLAKLEFSTVIAVADADPAAKPVATNAALANNGEPRRKEKDLNNIMKLPKQVLFFSPPANRTVGEYRVETALKKAKVGPPGPTH